MAILRSLGKFFGSTIFTLALTSLLLIYALYNLTLPKNFLQIFELFQKPAVKFYLRNLTQEKLKQFHSFLVFACKKRDFLEVPVGEINLTLNCKEVEAVEAEKLPELVAPKIIKTYAERFYYMHYDCKFFECLKNKTQPFFIFSKQANQFYSSLILPLTLVTTFGLALMLVSVENWPSRLKVLGISLIFVGIIYFAQFLIQSFIERAIPQQFRFVAEVIPPLLAQIFQNFLYVLIVGIALIVTGFFLKRFK
jgi:hypothetical protein